MSELNPKTTHFEFSGPSGAAIISAGLPTLIIAMYFSCNEKGCPANIPTITEKIKTTPWFSWKVFGAYLLWIAVLMIMDLIVPGENVKGTQLRTGEHLNYKFNGCNVVLILGATLLYRAYSTQLALPELQFIYDHFLEINTSTLIVAVIFSTYLYLASFKNDKNGKPKLLALGGNSGNVMYDWFIGRELNPRWGPVDLKLFFEMRPGLLLWILIDLAMVHHQYLKYGHVSASILMVTVFQAYYVIEGTFYEAGLISMIDTTTDGFGFMLVFGDISLVPLTYSLQTRFLADHPVELSWLAIILITANYIGGLLIFRLSNNEKNRFKSGDPSTKHLKYITSASGSKLLVSGWWGMARHINYTGDWISTISYCLPCGLTLIPYYHLPYFASLLIHRNDRDEAKCAAKYGKTWDEYKEKVPYKFIPYVY